MNITLERNEINWIDCIDKNDYNGYSNEDKDAYEEDNEEMMMIIVTIKSEELWEKQTMLMIIPLTLLRTAAFIRIDE